MCVIGVLKCVGAKEIMAENLLYLIKTINPQTQVVQQTLDRKNIKKTTPKPNINR